MKNLREEDERLENAALALEFLFGGDGETTLGPSHQMARYAAERVAAILAGQAHFEDDEAVPDSGVAREVSLEEIATMWMNVLLRT